MANVLNKTADPVDYRTSVNDPDFPPAIWFINPDISAVAGVATKYWARPLTDPVTEMTPAEQQAVDDAEAAALVDQNRALGIEAADTEQEPIGWQTRGLIELLNKRDNYLTNRIIELQDAMDAMKASVGAASAIRDAIPANWSATETRPRNEAIVDYKLYIDAGGADT